MSRSALEPIADLMPLRDEWAPLAERTGNVFATWEWNELWWRHFGHQSRLAGSLCRAPDGRLAAVLPLYFFARRPLRVLRFLGHGCGDQLGPICAPEDRELAAAGLAAALGMQRWDALVAEELSADEGWSRRLGGRVLRREGSPLVRAQDGWEAYLSARSSNFRQQVRRRERRLAESYDLRYRLSGDAERLETDLDALFALHRARWGERGPFTGAEAFQRAFARAALERGWLRLWLLELDGRTAAALLGYRYAGIESFYQGGRDPALPEDAVGLVLLAHVVRSALDDGVREYRLLRGGEDYKYRFATDDAGLETFVIGRGVRGALGVRLAAALAGGPLARARRALR